MCRQLSRDMEPRFAEGMYSYLRAVSAMLISVISNSSACSTLLLQQISLVVHPGSWNRVMNPAFATCRRVVICSGLHRFSSPLWQPNQSFPSRLSPKSSPTSSTHPLCSAASAYLATSHVTQSPRYIKTSPSAGISSSPSCPPSSEIPNAQSTLSTSSRSRYRRPPPRAIPITPSPTSRTTSTSTKSSPSSPTSHHSSSMPVTKHLPLTSDIIYTCGRLPRGR